MKLSMTLSETYKNCFYSDVNYSCEHILHRIQVNYRKSSLLASCAELSASQAENKNTKTAKVIKLRHVALYVQILEHNNCIWSLL